jgi:hypothetical protein
MGALKYYKAASDELQNFLNRLGFTPVLVTALFINMRNREKKKNCVPYYKSRPHPR